MKTIHRLIQAGFASLMWVLIASAGEPTKAPELPPLHHPVYILPPQKMVLPDDFKLGKKGELTCTTCHGIEDLEKIPLDEVDSKDPDFLRHGPFENLLDFCYLCHEKRGMERFNVHQMIDKNGGLDKDRCLYCHVETPDPKKVTDPTELEFRLPPEKLCLGCHLKTPHLNVLPHLTEPSDKIREAMKEAINTQGIILPLDSRGRVTCITCHTPHEKGVIPGEYPAGKQVQEQAIADGIAYGDSAWDKVYQADKSSRLNELRNELEQRVTLPPYQRIEKEILLRLPAKSGDLCRTCHRFEE